MKVYENIQGAYIKLSSRVLFKKANFKAGDEFAVRVDKGEINLIKIEKEVV